MSEPKFTPGPWSSFPMPTFRKFYIGLKPYRSIAEVRHGSEDIPGTIDANASLIAAAPELYDALKTLTDKLAALMADSIGVAGLHLNGDVAEWSSLTDGGAYEEWLSGITDARTALRKARGE